MRNMNRTFPLVRFIILLSVMAIPAVCGTAFAQLDNPNFPDGLESEIWKYASLLVSSYLGRCRCA